MLVPMKTPVYIWLIILFQTFSMVLPAQEAAEKIRKSGGLLLGPGISNFSGGETSTAENRFIPGLSLGFYQNFVISRRCSLETGLLLTSKGSRLDVVGDLYLHQVLTYLEAPLLGEYQFFISEKVRFHLAGGAYLSMKLLAFNEVGFPEQIHRMDMGLDVGLGMRFRTFSYRIEVKRGLLEVDKCEQVVNYKNLTVSLLVGIAF